MFNKFPKLSIMWEGNESGWDRRDWVTPQVPVFNLDRVHFSLFFSVNGLVPAHRPPSLHLQRNKTSPEINTYSTAWVFICRERSQSGTVQSGKSSRHGSTELRRAWNGNQCCCFFVFFVVVCFDSSLGNLGRPFRPFFFLRPSIPRLLRVWWHHGEL